MTPAWPALVCTLGFFFFSRNSPHDSGSGVVSRGGRAWTMRRCSPRRTANISVLTSNFSAARCSLAAGCSPYGRYLCLVYRNRLYASSLLLVVSLFLLTLVPVGVQSTLTAVGPERTSLVKAVVIEAVATPSVRPRENATRARARTLVRQAHFSCGDFVDVLTSSAMKAMRRS